MPYSWLVPPGADTPHTISLLAKTNCPDGGNGWKITQARIDVVRALAG